MSNRPSWEDSDGCYDIHANTRNHFYHRPQVPFGEMRDLLNKGLTNQQALAVVTLREHQTKYGLIPDDNGELIRITHMPRPSWYRNRGAVLGCFQKIEVRVVSHKVSHKVSQNETDCCLKMRQFFFDPYTEKLRARTINNSGVRRVAGSSGGKKRAENAGKKTENCDDFVPTTSKQLLGNNSSNVFTVSLAGGFKGPDIDSKGVKPKREKSQKSSTRKDRDHERR